MRILHLLSVLTFAVSVGAADQIANPFPPVIVGGLEGGAVDGFGNKYVTGTVSGGGRDFNPGTGADFKILSSSSAAFITRYNTDGTYAWTQTFDGSLTEEGAGVVINNGIAYWFGTFNSTDAIIGTGPTQFSSTSTSVDVFIIALDAATGSPIATFGSNGLAKFGGTANDDIDTVGFDNGVVYFGGSTQSNDILFFGAGPINNIGGALNEDGYIAAFNPATGMPVTAFSGDGVQFFGGSGTDNVSAITISSGTLYVTGEFTSSDAGLGASGPLMSTGQEDVFVLALNTSGAAVTAFSGDGIQQFGGSTGSDSPDAIAVGPGVVYVGGTFFSNNASIGGAGSFAADVSGAAFILALDISTGAPITNFDADGLLIFGGTGQEDVESLVIQGSTLFVAGQTVSPNFAIGSSTPFAAPSGSPEVYFAALSPSTGVPIPVFGGDGVKQFGGGSSDFVVGTAVFGSNLLVIGNFFSTDAGFDGPGGFNSTGFEGFMVALNLTNGNPTQAPTGASLSASANPAAVGSVVTFTGSATDPDNDTLFFNWSFGDGSQQVQGNPVMHTFASGGTFTVTLSVSDGARGASPVTLAFDSLAPNSGGTGISNPGTGKPPIENPLNGLTITINKSEGGVIELAVNVSALRADEFTADTAFDGIAGRQANRLRTLRPTNKFTNAGLSVATSTAKDAITDADTGKKGRKMLAVSRQETGEPALATGTPASLAIVASSLKGKFIFAGSKPDQVTFNGIVELPAGMDLAAEQTLEFGMGNVLDSVVFDVKGKPKLPSTLGRIKKAKLKLPKLKKGVTALSAGQTASVTITYQIANLVTAGFDTEGIQADLRSEEAGLKVAPRKIQMALVLAGVAYESLIDVDYKVAPKKDSGSFIKTRAAK